MNALTDRQRDLLDAIRQSMEDRGYPPTVSELGKTIRLASDDAVKRELRILQFKGWLKPIPGTRAVQIIDHEEASHGGAA